MFDFAGSEIALVAVVALILIGPKDLPVAIKAVTGMIKKARRMAAEFQVHVDDMMKDAELGDLRSGINEIRRMDIKGRILSAIDDDGSIRRSVSDVNTSVAPSWTPPPPPVPAVATPAIAAPSGEAAPLLGDVVPSSGLAAAPAFIPPRAARTAPAFIPPNASRA